MHHNPDFHNSMNQKEEKRKGGGGASAGPWQEAGPLRLAHQAGGIEKKAGPMRPSP